MRYDWCVHDIGSQWKGEMYDLHTGECVWACTGQIRAQVIKEVGRRTLYRNMTYERELREVGLWNTGGMM